MTAPSYHDLYITTGDIPRTSIFNLGFGLQVTCTRTAGWELWRTGDGRGHLMNTEGPVSSGWTLMAGEYAGDEKGLRLDVDGTVIVDSLAVEVVA